MLYSTITTAQALYLALGMGMLADVVALLVLALVLSDRRKR